VKHRTRAALIGIAIALFWVVMMGSLLKDTIFSRSKTEEGEPINPRDLLQNWQDYEEWMQVFLNDEPVGVFNAAVKKDDAKQHYTASLRLIIAVNVGVAKTLVRWEGLASLDRNFVLQKFFLSADLGFSKLNITGMADGKQILYKVTRGSETAYGGLKLGAPASFLDAATDLVLRKVDLKTGETFRIRAVDPIWTFDAGEVEITVNGREIIRIDHKPIETYRVETRMMNVKTVSWVTESGQTMKRQLLEGITMSLISKSKAIELFPELKSELQFPPINLGELRSNVKTASPTFGILKSLQNLVGTK
jgi:hypothetical protein